MPLVNDLGDGEQFNMSGAADMTLVDHDVTIDLNQFKSNLLLDESMLPPPHDTTTNFKLTATAAGGVCPRGSTFKE